MWVASYGRDPADVHPGHGARARSAGPARCGCRTGSGQDPDRAARGAPARTTTPRVHTLGPVRHTRRRARGVDVGWDRARDPQAASVAGLHRLRPGDARALRGPRALAVEPLPVPARRERPPRRRPVRAGRPGRRAPRRRPRGLRRPGPPAGARVAHRHGHGHLRRGRRDGRAPPSARRAQRVLDRHAAGDRLRRPAGQPRLGARRAATPPPHPTSRRRPPARSPSPGACDPPRSPSRGRAAAGAGVGRRSRRCWSHPRTPCATTPTPSCRRARPPPTRSSRACRSPVIAG